MKAIEIQIKEWRDKTYGNTYFSARIYICKGLDDDVFLYIPFQYGDANHGEHEAIKEIQKVLNLEKSGYSFKDTANNAGFHYYCNSSTDRKKMVEWWGKE